MDKVGRDRGVEGFGLARSCPVVILTLFPGRRTEAAGWAPRDQRRTAQIGQIPPDNRRLIGARKETRLSMRCPAIALLAVGAILLVAPALLRAQGQGGHRHDPPGDAPAFGDGKVLRSLEPQPYGGQIYCPVEGVKLGLDHPPVPVQTSIGEQKPTFLEKLMGKKGKPGLVIHACCPACAEKIQANPWPYLQETIADKTIFTFPYSLAPAQRPPRVRVDSDLKPPD